ncbi:MAG: hypothetical protein WCK03_03370 [Candidatus Taylorbacteria bacterium]
MKKELSITPEYIKGLSYTDFVGLINQWNVLPGSHVTLSKWAYFSGLNKNSRLLLLKGKRPKLQEQIYSRGRFDHRATEDIGSSEFERAWHEAETGR